MELLIKATQYITRKADSSIEKYKISKMSQNYVHAVDEKAQL